MNPDEQRVHEELATTYRLLFAHGRLPDGGGWSSPPRRPIAALSVAGQAMERALSSTRMETRMSSRAQHLFFVYLHQMRALPLMLHSGDDSRTTASSVYCDEPRMAELRRVVEADAFEILQAADLLSLGGDVNEHCLLKALSGHCQEPEEMGLALKD